MIHRQSESIAALAKALVKVQGALQPAKKDSTNPFYKSTYADLESVWDACRAVLQANGLSVTQWPGFESEPPYATLTTVLLHESGEWIAGTAGAPLKQVDAQGMGSALTYLRRYALAAVVGIVQQDDDGQAATKPAKREERGGSSSEAKKAKEASAAAPGASSAPASPTPRELTYRGKALTEYTDSELVAIRDWARKKGGDKLVFADRADEILDERRVA